MAKPIMIQGTMSNAGKSLIAAGLCRVFAQDGYKVAPFKSQNMALNSFITGEGLEMGRAQVVQAEACGIEPSVNMNPILLKPVSNMGSQVIVNGEVLGNMQAAEYYAAKHQYIPDIMNAYAALDAEYDIIVIEGAGSPAEINLKADDLVNMGMARMAKAPVLLAGDIDRGGVFAQLAGTLMLLEPDEQDMVKALIINKFRGDIEILKPGLEMLTQRTSKRVAGVLPMLDVDIDDEDSLASRLTAATHGQAVDIAVIRLPHISNFTDFMALEAMAGVGVRYVGRASELGRPDMAILPGTKNTMADLRWLRQSGIEAGIKRLADEGRAVFGICGGYQMLGRNIVDEEGVEGGGSIKGLGLLLVDTRFLAEKHRTRVKGRILEVGGTLAGIGGAVVEGYEIHMGETALMDGAKPLLRLENGSYDGCHSGNIYGTYLHGLFDTEDMRSSLLQCICAAKGIAVPEADLTSMETYKQQQYDKLAEGVRANLDMDMIYKILEEGI